MDALSEPGVDRIVLMTSAQIGKTEILNNIIGFHIAQDPAPILVLQPTLEMAETWSKDRLSPMLRDSPCLKDKVADPRSRDSGNTLLHKKFLGGHVTAVGANSAAGLASRPIRIVMADEVDRYPVSAGAEGDPLSLAIKRTTTFWNRRIVMCSTPTVKGISRIEAEFEKSDKRRYFVACPHCQHEQHLVWAQVRWPEGKPHEALYHCEECGAGWSDAERRAAIRWGEWRSTAEKSSVVGFHLNELYSPWATVADVAQAFMEAKRSHETIKTWVNTSLGETWEEDADGVDAHSLASRLEDWNGAAPQGVLMITAGVDVQDDRLHIEKIGWGAGEESWSLDYRVFYGDPSSPQVWKELTDYLTTPTVREDGMELDVRMTCVDSGGHFTQAVYKYARTARLLGVRAIKGVLEGPVFKLSKGVTGAKNRVHLVGTKAAKDIIYARLKTEQPGPAYCHFPKGRDATFFDELTAEVVKTKYVKGFPTRVYELPPSKRNEALDCRCYGFAALQMVKPSWGELLGAVPPRRRRELPKVEVEQPKPVTPRPQEPRKSSWLDKRNGWMR